MDIQTYDFTPFLHNRGCGCLFGPRRQRPRHHPGVLAVNMVSIPIPDQIQLFSLDPSLKKGEWHYESLDPSLEKGSGIMKVLIPVLKKEVAL